MWRIIGKTLFILTCVALTLVCFFRIIIGVYLPSLDGTVAMSGLKDKVQVIRDSRGVPHILAENANDAYRALGYAVAQDRLFQMDIQRRVARGELSEILGEKTVKVDRMFRTYGFLWKARQMLAKEQPAAPAVLEMADSFLAGVNAFIAEDELPVEYDLLSVSLGYRYKPRAFTREDSLALIGYMAYSFAEGFKGDSLAYMFKEKFPSLDVEMFFPGYDFENDVTIMESQPEVGRTIDHIKEPFYYKKNHFKLEKWGLKKSDLPVMLAQQIEQGFMFSAAFEGSNSWVLAPAKSKTGAAILANDPHISYSNPGVWYEAHISYPGYENYGYHLPLLPFPLIGHNNTKAWALTMLENDDVNLYIEDINDKQEYLFKGVRRKLQVQKETIKVKGQSDQIFEIRRTGHGPLITDFLEGYKGKPVSLSWTYLDADVPVIDGLHEIAASKNLKQFEAGVSKIAAPGLNISYADKEGNIAWYAAAAFSIYPAGVNTKMIMDGVSGKAERIGFLPFEKNPRLVNPKNGIIVTANNLVTSNPPAPISKLYGYWQPSDRMARLVELLSVKRQYDMDDMKRIQTDNYLWSAPRLLAVLVREFEVESNMLKRMNDSEAAVYQRLKDWNYYNTTDSVEAGIFHHLRYFIFKELVSDEIGDENLVTYGRIADHWNFFKSAMMNPHHPAWDNVNTPTKEPRRAILLKAFKATVKHLAAEYGDDMENWTWGEMHTVEYVHPLGRAEYLDTIFNIGPISAPAAAHTVNNIKSRLAEHTFKAKSGPSVRRIINFSDQEYSYTVLPIGNSGNLGSRYYGDQVEMYINGEYRRIVFSNRQILEDNAHVLTLVPSAAEMNEEADKAPAGSDDGKVKKSK